MLSNIHNGGPQDVSNAGDARRAYILKFYDSSIPESQYYKYEDILGFERGSGKFFIYFKGAKDVNAKDKVEITVTGSTISIADSIELIINAPLYETVHQNTTAIIQIVSDTVGESIRYEFSQARITYGTCCSGGGSGRDITVKDEGVTKTTALTSLDFVGSGVTATNSGGDVTVTIPGSTDYRSQHVSHSLYESGGWTLSTQYCIPALDRTAQYHSHQTNSLNINVDTGFPIFSGSAIQRASAPFNKITCYSMSRSALTATQIAALGSGGLVKAILIRYTPADGDTSLTFQKTLLGTVQFNAIANRIEKTDFSVTLSTPLSLGDYWGIAYEWTVTSGDKTGRITQLALQSTAKAWIG